jgi:hypothetical protein
VVKDAADLAGEVERLLRDPEATGHVARLAAEVVEAGSGALAATLEALAPWLPDGGGQAPHAPARTGRDGA